MGKAYSREYRVEAIKLVNEIGKKEAVKRLDVTEWTLNQWVKKAGQEKKEEKAQQTTNLRTELREAQEKIAMLEKENARIRKENEFLEEASRFFAGSRQK
jgi:transposase